MRQGQRGQDLIYLTFCYLLDNHQAVRTRSALIARSLSNNVTFYIYIEKCKAIDQFTKSNNVTWCLCRDVQIYL